MKMRCTSEYSDSLNKSVSDELIRSLEKHAVSLKNIREILLYSMKLRVQIGKVYRLCHVQRFHKGKEKKRKERKEKRKKRKAMRKRNCVFDIHSTND